MKNFISTTILILIIASSVSGQKIKILTNHLGYNPAGPKNAVIEAYDGDEIIRCFIKNFGDDKLIATLQPVKVVRIDEWKNWYFHTVDFSAVEQEGEYYIECETNKGIIRSFPFKIQNNILERHTISDVLCYFRSQRSVGQFEKADRQMTFKDGRLDTVDVHGGWQDASGDYGKHLSHLSFSTYFNPQQKPMVVYSLCKSYELLDRRNDENFNQVKRRIIDEILFGADYLVRIKNPSGSFYRSISAPGPGKKPEDRIIASEGEGYSITKKKDEVREMDKELLTEMNKSYEVGYRAGAGIAIASLAMASQFELSGDFNSCDYLKAAAACSLVFISSVCR